MIINIIIINIIFLTISIDLEVQLHMFFDGFNFLKHIYYSSIKPHPISAIILSLISKKEKVFPNRSFK